MWKNRANRKVADMPRMQGYKNYETGETHAPLNNHQPRTGISKWKHKRKCHCKDNCGGCKAKTIAERDNWKLRAQKGEYE